MFKSVLVFSFVKLCIIILQYILWLQSFYIVEVFVVFFLECDSQMGFA